ncbi:MAG: hypothetical protein ACF8CY_06140 [Gimesia chilikensis]
MNLSGVVDKKSIQSLNQIDSATSPASGIVAHTSLLQRKHRLMAGNAPTVIEGLISQQSALGDGSNPI